MPRFVIHHQRFTAILLAPDPAHDASGHVETLVSRQIHRERTYFPKSQRQIAREPPTSEGEILYGALALK